MSRTNITIQVKLFAIYQEVYQQEEISLEIKPQSTAMDVLDLMIKEHPPLVSWQSITKLAVNLEFIPADYILQDGDELALIPPVSGGVQLGSMTSVL